MNYEWGVRPVQPKWKESALQGGLAWLLSLGLTLTLLGVTGLIRHGLLAAFVLLGVCGAAAALSLMGKRARLAVYCAGGFGGVLWLLLGGGAMVGEVIQALIWHLSGLPAALPLVSAPFAVLVSLLCGVLAWFVTQRSAGPYPALLLMLMAALLLWLGNRPG